MTLASTLDCFDVCYSCSQNLNDSFEKMQGVHAEHVQADDGSGCASSSAAGEASPVYPILYCERLLQQFVVDTYIKIESSRVDYMFHHPKELRADLYQGLMDSIQARQQDGNAVGKRTILASSFIGGPRDKLRRYLDAMALVRKGGSTIEEERLKK